MVSESIKRGGTMVQFVVGAFVGACVTLFVMALISIGDEGPEDKEGW